MLGRGKKESFSYLGAGIESTGIGSRGRVSLRKKEPASHSDDSDIASFIAAFLNVEKKTSCFRMIITAES